MTMRSFAWSCAFGGLAAVMAPLSARPTVAAAPNVVVILADDLGFSDLGCYGSEIDTPNLDRLAAGGVRFTQGYNTARCWPSRASILTGYYPQAVRRDALPGVAGGTKGTRPAWARLLPELLAPAGYRSYHSGKWHVDGDPRRQGFDRSLQIEGGQNDYFDPAGITVDGRPIEDREGFYITTVVGEHAAECLKEHAADHPGTPFFSYVAFTSPHFPLHAPQDLVAKYRARYAAGWDAVQQARQGRIRSMGLVTSPPAAMEREVGPPYRHAGALEILGAGEVDRPLPWNELTAEQREFQITKMAIHAAMIDAMDQAVGKIVAQLEAMAALENTLILFASDNGGSAEIMVRGKGHDPKLPAGGPGTYLCLGPGWSSCANTPFRRHKTWVHEGGIATPWIVHWPKGIATKGSLRTQPVHLVDVAPTVLAVAGVEAPLEHAGGKVPPMQGRSFAAALRDASAAPREEPLWWCHEGHRAVRVGDWKLVAAKGTPWELYDLSADRCETKDLASAEPARVASLETAWNRIADECRSLAAPVDRGASKGSRPPSVVVIFCDDLGYGDPACYGGTAAPTPNIDRLARDGIRFTDFHVAQAVCSASRAALLTGCYPNRLGIHGALGPKSTHGIAASETTLAELLRDRGYRTACVGKWHLGHHPPFLPTRHGFDEYFGLPYSNDMWPHHPEAKPGTFPPLPLFENETVIDPAVSAEAQSTLTARYVERAVSFIERAGAAPDGRPFFLYLAHSMPHVPLFAGRTFRGTSAGGLYGDVLAEIDASVGAVLAALDRTGRADDTLVIFTSDNGPWLSYGNHAGSSGGLREGKGTAFEGGVRVPCVARLPGRIPSGIVSGEPLMTIDLLPSIARLTGEPLARDASGRCLVAGRPIDGHDRLDLLCGGSRDAGDDDRYLFYYKTNELQAVRQGPWKLFFPHEFRSMEGQAPGKDGIPGTYSARRLGRSLHHLGDDPAESRDVAAGHPEVVARLEAIAEDARADLGDRLAGRAGSGSRSPGTLPPRRPNIVFFLCDDLGGGDIAALGSKDIRTPNIDSLFARGTRLSRHWSGSAVCAPSRCVLMTGRHPGHAVVRSNREVKPEGQAPMPQGTVTLARLLKDAGYATGGFGKWGLGAPGSVSDPIACGFDEFFGYNCQRQAHSFYPDHLWNGRERVDLDGKTYSADLIAERQLAFIKAHAADPFFLYVPTTVPHLALQVPDDEPSLAEYARHFGDEEPYLGGRGYQPCRRPLATYAAMITRMDREVGRIVKLLEELKLADDTIFVFSSDNGATWPGIGGGDTGRLRSNGDLRDWKGSPYEGGLRVPTVAVWPGRIPAGKVIDAPSGFEDWLPTLLDLAGLGDRIPSGLDGTSLAGALRGAAVAQQDRVLYRELTEARWQAAVLGRWKAIRKAASRKQPEKAAPTELYDLAADPSESRDVASERPEVVVRLEAVLDREHVPDPAWPLPFADVGGGPKKEASAKPSGKRPNILYIIVDDQSPFDFRFYNPASTLHAPVIERLAAEGMVFDAAYHMGSFSGAVCTPSRHMVMSGRSVWHLPIGPNSRKRAKGEPPPPQSPSLCPPGLERFTMAPIFNAAGYDTMRTCKIGNAYEAADALFTVRRDATRRGGTDESGSVWHGDQVMDYLAERERSKDPDPFLIYFGFSHPHDTRDGTPELLAKYGAMNHADQASPPQADPRQPPLPPNWLPKHPFDNTDMRVRDEVSVSGVWRRRDEATIRNELGREYACSENIDRQIGRVLEKLAAMGELDNTWVFYTADHGIAIGRHGLQGKQNLYEHTWRVPFVVKGPGVKPGSRVPGNIYLGDSFATLCDIAGIPSPDTNEGTSFLPVLEGKREAVRDVLYGVYCGGEKPGMRSVRKGAWKLLKYESPAGGLHTQLFNLEENPHELLAEHHDPAVTARLPAAPAIGQRNLADDPAHAVKRSEMESLLLAEMRRHDDPFRFSDQAGQADHADHADHAVRPSSRPNCVVIFIDDLGYGDIGPFGGTKQRTPNLDRMAAEGMRLSSFYAAPVCSVSRAQLLTGCYGLRVGVPGVYFPAGANGLNPEEVTVAERLKSLGYATACVGKWHLGDQPEFLPTRQGFDRYYGIPYSNDMQRVSAETGERVVPLLRDEKVDELLTDAMQSAIVEKSTAEAVRFIEESKSGPFFLYMPHTAVHAPIVPGRNFQGKSRNGKFGDWVEEVDWSVGEILGTLRRLALDEDTLVIFTSDNGPWVSVVGEATTAGPLRGSKGSTWEGGVRVPTIARWPGRIAPGSTCDAVAGTIDLLPTLVSLAGGSVPAEPLIDGRDISRLLLGTSTTSPREAHYYFAGGSLQAVRKGPWKLTIAPQAVGMGRKKDQPPEPASVDRPRLYHLDDDIGETTDVAAGHPAVVAELRVLAMAMQGELGDPQSPARRPHGSVASPRTIYPTVPQPKRSDEKQAGGRPDGRSEGKAPDGKPPAAAVPVRPNIVLVLADDLGYGELGCYGNAAAITPNLDRFASQGLRLTDCHSASSVCSPSRSSLLTGRTPFRNGVFTWIPEGSPIHLRTSEIALPKLLKEAGYDTCHVGKWHLNGLFNSPEQPQPNDHGYDWWLGTQNNAAPSHAFPANFVRNGQAIGKVDDYSAPFIAREAVEWLKTKRDPAKPFFLAVWAHEPHYPIASADRYEKLHASIADPEERTYRANVTQLDDAFGTLMKAIDEIRVADSTLVFFTSDNGPEGAGDRGPGRGLAGPLRGRKRSMYEGGHRVPGILRWPGKVEPGSVSDRPVIGSDFFPTALKAAGLEPPRDRVLDGVDICVPGAERPRPLYWRWGGFVAYREGPWKIVADESLEKAELYDLAEDMAEATDLATREPERLAAMLDRLRGHTAEIEREGPDWWKREQKPRKKKSEKAAAAAS